MVELYRIDPADGHQYEWYSYLEHYCNIWDKKSKKPLYSEAEIEKYWYDQCLPIFGHIAEDRRIDPSDQQSYTCDEFVSFYKSKYSVKHIKNYWHDCKQAPVEEEKRIDPTDMTARTFKEIQECYPDFDEKEVQRYWDETCAFCSISPLLLPESEPSLPDFESLLGDEDVRSLLSTQSAPGGILGQLQSSETAEKLRQTFREDLSQANEKNTEKNRPTIISIPAEHAGGPASSSSSSTAHSKRPTPRGIEPTPRGIENEKNEGTCLPKQGEKGRVKGNGKGKGKRSRPMTAKQWVRIS